MVEAVEFDWVPWRDCVPDPAGGPVEVASDAWRGIRLWRPAVPPPDGITGVFWRPCDEALLPLATHGGLYDGDAQPLLGSPPLVAGGFDQNGLWPQMFVLRLPHWPHCGPVARLWLVPPSGALAKVPADLLGDLVAVADSGDPVVMRGPDGDQLRALAGQIVGMTGGFRA